MFSTLSSKKSSAIAGVYLLLLTCLVPAAVAQSDNANCTWFYETSSRLKNAANLIDTIEDNYAHFARPTIAIGVTRLVTDYVCLGFENKKTMPANYNVGFIVSKEGTWLDASLFPTLTVITKDAVGQTLESKMIDANVVKTIMNGGEKVKTWIGFASTKEFSLVELKIEYLESINLAGSSNGGNLNVYRANAFPEDSPIDPLPVELINFKSTLENNQVVLNWQTASELNNSHFVVERKTGGATGFKSIGDVRGAGTSAATKAYSFHDLTLKEDSGSEVFYRLKQVDFDGTFSYSKVVAVNWRSSAKTKKMTVYPNPATNSSQIQVALQNAPMEPKTLSIFNREIKLIKQVQLYAQTSVVDTQGLPSGMYFVVLQGEQANHHFTEKLIIK